MKIIKLLLSNIILTTLFFVSFVFQFTNIIPNNIIAIINPLPAYAQTVADCTAMGGTCHPNTETPLCGGEDPVAYCDGAGDSFCCVPYPPPNCNTGIVCGGCQGVGTNTTCNANNGYQYCTYTAYTGGGTCNEVGAPTEACTINSCTYPSWACAGGVCIPYYTISGNITDVDGNGTPAIPVNVDGCGTSGGAYTFGYNCDIRAGTYTVSENLPANYIGIGTTAQGVTVGPNKGGVNFTVARVFQITGSITDVDGNGTPAVPVTCTDTGPGGAAGTVTGGNFTIPYGDHFRRGNVTCHLDLPANYIAINPASGALPAFALTADKTGVNFTVARVFQITGSITDVDGNGTPTTVSVTCTDTKTGLAGGQGAATEGGGNFTIPYGSQFRRGNVTCALNLPANYIAINPASGALPAFALTADKTGVNFTVARVFSITGTITDVDGNGTPAIPVTCADNGPGGETATLTGGNFTFPYGDHFRRGEVTCTLALPANYIAINPIPPTIAFGVGPDRTGVNFNVARVFSISGEIVDVDGNGTPNIAVTCADNGPGGETATLTGGNFTFPYGDHFRRGEVTCTLALPANYIAINPNPPTIAFAVGPDRTGVEFDVARVFSVSGVVTDPYNGNAGVGGVAITSNGYTVNTNGAGDYTIPYAAHLRRGTHPVVLTIPNGWTNTTVTTQNVTVGPDAVGIDFGVTKLFSVSGNVFIDPNIDGIEEAGEVNYTAQASHLGYLATLLGISNFQPNPPTPFTTGNGAYTVNQLITGPFTISYALPNPPPIWYMTSPIDGPPPAFQVNVGYTCNVNAAPGAACNNGNIVNLDFGIIDNVPWIQSTCGDIRNDNGIIDQVPTAHQAIITNASCTNPGVAFTGNTDANFGDGQASTTNQVAGGATYPEVYASQSQIATSYTYLNQKAQTAQIPEIALSSVCNITNCTLPANLGHAIYTANGNVTLNGYTFPANENYVFLINGNLTIDGNIQIPAGSTATFSTANNIIITANVGSAQTVTTSNLDGWYVAGNSFITDSTMPGTCDLRLNIGGAIVVNTEGTGGTLQNNRNLCAGNALYPSLSITSRLDFLLNAPEFVDEEQTISQELAP